MAYISSEKRTVSSLMNHPFVKCLWGQTLTVQGLQGQMGHSPEDPVGMSTQKQTIIIQFDKCYKIYLYFLYLSKGILP